MDTITTLNTALRLAQRIANRTALLRYMLSVRDLIPMDTRPLARIAHRDIIRSDIYRLRKMHKELTRILS